MYRAINSKIFDRAGAYDLSEVYMVSYASTGGDKNPVRVNISGLVQEMNIYEHLENDVLSGDMVLADADNLLYKFPVTGFERLEFKLNTPGLDKGLDCSISTGYPMFVYSVSERKPVNPRTQGYIINFCSIEAIKNHQKRVCKSLATTIDDMVVNVLRNDLKTQKNIFVEETSGTHKYTLPLEKPFTTIKNLGKFAKSKNFDNSGYLFYENIFGFHFKSYESLFCKGNGQPRPEVAFYTPKVKNEKIRNIINDMQSVEDFTIKSQFNTLKNVQSGTYSSRMITHDSFNKTFKTYDFNYNTNYINQNHLEMGPKGEKIDNNGIVPYFNFEEGQGFSDFYEGVLHLSSHTQKIHNDFELPNPGEITQKRVSQKNALGSIVIEIIIPGFTGITVGDIVRFNTPKYTSASKAEPNDNDPYMSGRFLISGLRHHISTIGKRHTTILELVKDSTSTPFAEEDLDLFTNNQSEEGDNYLQYDIDNLS